MCMFGDTVARLLRALALLSILHTSVALRPSDGCKHVKSRELREDATAPASAGASLEKKELRVADFEEVVRTYWVQKPPRPSVPAPLLVALHGQTQFAPDYGASHEFGALGKDENLMTIFPQGMNDTFSPAEDQGTGWNTGSAGNNQTCVPAGVGTLGGCYRSCRALKLCGRCNWSTCYNDVLFVKTLIDVVAKDFCVDLDRVYGHGESNGAMMMQHLVRELPSTFAGVSTWFGTPLLGYLLGSRLQLVSEQLQLSRTAILALHGRNDTTIPPGGGVQDNGWIYEPLEQSTGVWAALHHCSDLAQPLKTQYDGGPLNFQCAEYPRCVTGRRVVQCMYNGVHGDWPTGFDGDHITLWFLFQFDRSKPLAPTTPQQTAEIKAEGMTTITSSKKSQETQAPSEDLPSSTAEPGDKDKAIADYLNRKPTRAPVVVTTPEPTNAPRKISAEDIAAQLP